ncbi:MAG: hypothetical protein JW697_05625 [Kosmotogaceae bacterium]|nr:hypothetical protein [Kosmotogaceae bacterium]
MIHYKELNINVESQKHPQNLRGSVKSSPEDQQFTTVETFREIGNGRKDYSRIQIFSRFYNYDPANDARLVSNNESI